MVFVDDKTAADRVIRLAVNRFVAGQRGNAHAVFVQRQVVRMEIHAMVNREFNLMLTVRQQQTTVGVHILDEARDRININGIRQVPRQAHDNGDIGMVAFPGQRKGTVNIDNHAGNVMQDAACNQVVRELLTGFHWSDGVRAGRTNTDFEDIEYANHDASIAFSQRGRSAPSEDGAGDNQNMVYRE